MTEQTPKQMPMLFKPELVRAHENGRKTQTRRPFKPHDSLKNCTGLTCGFSNLTPARCVEWRGKNRYGEPFSAAQDIPWGVGDLLWVKTHKAMSRDESRQTLVITSLKPHRLHDISEDDAWAEGVCEVAEEGTDFPWPTDEKNRRLFTQIRFGHPVNAFHYLWDDCYPGKHHWSTNPWVSAITYEVHLMNIDEFLKMRAA